MVRFMILAAGVALTIGHPSAAVAARYHVAPICAGQGSTCARRIVRHRVHGRHHRRARAPRSIGREPGNLVTIDTAENPITVAASVADRFRSLIAELVGGGYRGRINCYARTGHVRGSLHHSGEACDFAQTGWGRTPAAIMYRAGEIIARHGLRDGCSFGDCGHVDTGRALDRGHARARHHRHRHRHR